MQRMTRGMVGLVMVELAVRTLRKAAVIAPRYFMKINTVIEQHVF
jgi:hypothetical protein